MVREYGYEYDATLDEELAYRTEGLCVSHLDHGAILLRSGRDALKAVAREYNHAVVFLPTLSCNSMVAPFELYGHEVVFYRLKADYSVEVEDLLQLFEKKNRTVLLLYLNYFGNLAFTDSQLENIRKQYAHTVFIEDRTHDLIYPRQNAFEPEYTVASLRKWLNIPDGGLLWTNLKLKEASFSDDTTFSIERRNAQCMRRSFLASGDETIKTEYRRIFSTVTDQIDKDPLPCRMSEYAYEMALSADWMDIRKIREENAAVILDALSKSMKTQFIQTSNQRSNLYVPILTEDRDSLQRKLSAKGIFTTLIWPINGKQRNCCSVARYTEEHMLGIPCDQRYNFQDMQYISTEILETLCK